MRTPVNFTLFSPTINKIGLSGNIYRLYGGNEWTTNAFWAIKTFYEPKNIKKVRVTNTDVPDMTGIIAKAVLATNEVTFENELKTSGEAIMVKTVCDTGSHYFEGWVNVYFVSMMLKLSEEKKVRIKFYQGSKDGLIAVKTLDGEIIGVLMPIRSNE